nr:extracellular solute-binding protein [Akkermansiaceae bacterium]
PADLTWEKGLDQPELGSEEAIKGGTFHTYIPGNAYPPTIRSLGREANNGFRSYHWDDVEMGLVGLHPNTMKVIPGLADRWAVAEDGQSVYFHIDDDARWSDGRPVVAGDFTMAFYVYLSEYLTETYYRAYYGDQFWGISTYGDDYLCVRIAYPKPLAPFFANLAPFQEEFYREFGPDFEERYNWRPRPTTGAYMIRSEDLVFGRSIAMTRVTDWWAKDRKYYKNRFNVDRIEYRLVRDEEKIFQMFLRGDMDTYWLNDAKKWYERTEVPQVFEGHIERVTFYNDYPRPSRGFYFNLSKPLLKDLDIRIGLSHATNWEKVIELDLRGDAQRLNLLNEGFGPISNPDIRAREFSVKKALEAFARAGFTRRGDDGILMDDSGRRLSFTISYIKNPTLEGPLLRIKEEAKRAGVEYRLEGLDQTENFKKVTRKEHEIAFAGWAITPPFPDYYQQFHSKDAYLEDGKTPRPMTNNISIFADPEVDKILEANRNARSMEDLISTSHELERIFHERAVWVPAFQRPFYRLGYWRWIRWPEDFNFRVSSEPEVSHVHWIDPKIKEETLTAMSEKRGFDEAFRVYDQYRSKPRTEAAETAEEDPAPKEPVENAAEGDSPQEGGNDE